MIFDPTIKMDQIGMIHPALGDDIRLLRKFSVDAG